MKFNSWQSIDSVDKFSAFAEVVCLAIISLRLYGDMVHSFLPIILFGIFFVMDMLGTFLDHPAVRSSFYSILTLFVGFGMLISFLLSI